MKKSYTILISPNDKNSSYKKLYLKAIHLRFLTIGSCLTAFALLIFAIDYITAFSDHINVQKYQNENKNLKNQLAQAHVQMKQLHSRINQMEDFARKIKIIAGLERHSPSHLIPIGPLPNLPPLNYSHSSAIDAPPETKTIPEMASNQNGDSLLIYMNHLNEKSHLVRESITITLEQLYEKRDILNSTPSKIPVQGWISSHFGYRTYPFTGEVSLHEGIDIAAFNGTPVRAPSDGVVMFAGYQTGYGNVIIIDHGYQLSTVYAHLSDIMVSPWQELKRGDVIGSVGNTGHSSGPHLHYEVRISNVPVDPNNYILDSI